MNQYFLVSTTGRNPVAITALAGSAARSHADAGPRWFLLRTGRDEARPVGIHATDLSAGQQQRLERLRAATPGCALPADWLEDYPSDEAAENGKTTGSPGAYIGISPLRPSLPQPSPVGEYIKAR